MLALMWASAISLVMAEDTTLNTMERTLMSALTNAGNLVGCVLFPVLSDRYGRAFIYTKVIFLTVGGGLLFVFTVNVYMTYTACFFIGCSTGGDLATTASVMMESMPTQYRAKLAIMNIGYCIGPLICQLIALLINLTWNGPFEAWRLLIICITIITSVLAILRSCILESPIFLFGHRNSEFVQVISSIAYAKGRTSYSYKAPLLVQGELVDPERAAVSIFSPPQVYDLGLLALTMSILNFGFTGFIYFLPSFIHVETMFETYIALIIQQFCGISGMLLSSILINTSLGRRGTMAFGLILSGLMTVPFLSTSDFILLVVFSGTLYFGLMIGIACKNTITPESFPSECRGAGVGLVMSISRITGILAPIAAGAFYESGGFIISVGAFGLSLLLAGLSAYFLRETRPKTTVA